MDKNVQSAALATLAMMKASGTLGDLAEDQAAMLAASVSDDPEAQTAALCMVYGDKAQAENAAAKRDSEAGRARMEADHMSAMCRATGVTEDDAGRIMFDMEHGDQSPYLKLKERFYFG